MKRFWIAVLVALCAVGSAQAQTNDFSKQVNIKLRLVLEDNNYLYYGTSGAMRERWNTTTSRLELVDAAGNSMGYWTDAGTSSTFVVNGPITASGLNGGAGAGLSIQAGAGQILSLYDAGGNVRLAVSAAGGITSYSTITANGSRDLLSFRNLTLTTDATIGGDVAVNGGDITSSQATLNVFNTTSTTVNAFGLAQALTMGADGAGKTDIRNMVVTSQVNTFAANDTSPSVAGANLFVVPGTWTAGNNITALDDGVEGQTVTIVGGDADCAVTDGGTLLLTGNWTAAANDTLRLVRIGSNWHEIGRSDN